MRKLAALLILFFLGHDALVAQNASVVSGNAFLQTPYVEVGMTPCGVLGSTVQAPTGYHPKGARQGQQLTLHLGFVADVGSDGWTNGNPKRAGDYFLPGNPEESFALHLRNKEYANFRSGGQGSWNLCGNVGVPGGILSSTVNANVVNSVWQGLVDGLSMKSEILIKSGDLFFINKITFKNVGNTPTGDIYFMRMMDPDHGYGAYGYSTVKKKDNVIEYQSYSDACKRSLVSATYPAETGRPSLYFGIGTIDDRSRVSRNIGARKAKDVYDGITGSLSGSVYSDGTVGISFKLASLNPGEQTTFSIAYILNPSALTTALAATTTEFTVDGVLFAPGSTAPTCPQTVPITITKPAGYSWNWSPSTGLNTTTGNSVISTPTAPITYTASGTGACGNITATIRLEPSATPPPVVPVSAYTYCKDAVASQLQATGQNLKWYTQSTGGTATTTAPTPSTSIAGSFDYYVSQTKSQCGESDRVKITVVVTDAPQAPTIPAQNICVGSNPQPLTTSLTHPNWYAAATGGTGSSVAPTPTTTTVGTQIFYVSESVNNCESGRAAVVVNVQNCVPIAGPQNICVNANGNYSVTPQNGWTYQWQTNSPINAPIQHGPSVTFSWPTGGSVTLTVRAFNAQSQQVATSTITVLINDVPLPYILPQQRLACQFGGLTTDPDYQVLENMFNNGTFCMKACLGSSVTYDITNLPGVTTVWSATGGNIVSQTATAVTVLWTSKGTGLLSATVTTPSGCTATKTVCAEVITGPEASFLIVGESQTFCVGSPVNFQDQSVPDGSPIISWKWDFGDGTIITQSTPAVPTHIYQQPGGYTVTLTVTNACNCSSSMSADVAIASGEPFVINCPSVVCEGQVATYTATHSTSNCNSLAWEVEGGTVLSQSGNQITIAWDQVDANGFGKLMLTANCGPCPGQTTAMIPVIKQTGVIKGQQPILCADKPFLYRLPAWPGTVYNWSLVLGSGVATLKSTDQPNEVLVIPSKEGNISLVCNYSNSLVGCQGAASLPLQVSERREITGPEKLCTGSSATFAMSNGVGNWQWQIKHPGNTVTTGASGTAASATTPVLNNPGLYVISVLSNNFCEPAPKTLTVLAPPPAPTTITGPATVCTGIPYTYISPTPGSSFELDWSGSTNVFFVGAKVGTQVSVVFTGAGPWTLSVGARHRQQPACPSAAFSKTISLDVPNLAIAGQATACGSTRNYYSVPYTSGETYLWEINPPVAGSIANGNGSPNVQVAWNEFTGTAQLKLRVMKCNAEYNNLSNPYLVTINGTPNLTISLPTTLCQGEGFAPTIVGAGSGYSVEWDFGNGTKTTNLAYSYPVIAGAANTTFTVKAMVTSPSFCANPVAAAPVQVLVKPAPSVQLNPLYTSVGCNETPKVLFTATPSQQHEPTVELRWTLGGNLLSSCTNITDPSCYQYTGNSLGNWQAVAVAANGCSLGSDVAVIAQYCPPPCNIPGGASVSVNARHYGCGSVAGTGSYTGTGTPTTSWNVSSGQVLSSSASNCQVQFAQAGNQWIEYVANFGPRCYLTRKAFVFVPGVARLDLAVDCGYDGTNVSMISNSSLAGGYSVTAYRFYQKVGSNWVLLNSGTTNQPSYDDLYPAGLLQVRLEIDYADASGQNGGTCSAENQIQVPPATEANFSFSPATPCVGNPVVFTNTSTNYNKVLWDFGDQAKNREFNIERVYSAALNPATVTLTVENALGCVDVKTVQLEVNANGLNANKIFSTPDPAEICQGQSALLQVLSTGSSTPVSYQWFSHQSPVATTTIPQYSASTTGFYWVRLFDANGCFYNVNEALKEPVPVQVKLLPVPRISGSLHQCNGVDFALSCNYPGAGVDIVWKRNGASVGNGTETLTESLAQGSYNYTVTFTDVSSGCTVTSAPFAVTVHANPDEPAVAVNINNCQPFEAALDATVTGNPAGHYRWGNGMSGQNITVDQGGGQTLWFTDALTGCSSMKELWVPKRSDEYIWIFPTGCYSRCLPPDVVLPGTKIFLDAWTWLNNSSPDLGGTNSAAADYTLPGTGAYQLELTQGPCTTLSEVLNFTESGNCDPSQCDGLADVSIDEWRKMTGSCSFSFVLNLQNHQGQPLGYSLLSSVGGSFSPASGNTGPGGNINQGTVWTPPPGFSGSVYTITVRVYTADGYCDFPFTIEGGCTGGRMSNGKRAATSETASRYQLQPNPAQAETYLRYRHEAKGSADHQLLLYDATGRLLITQRLAGTEGSQRIPLSGYRPGIYQVVVRSTGGQIVHRQQLVVAGN